MSETLEAMTPDEGAAAMAQIAPAMAGLEAAEVGHPNADPQEAAIVIRRVGKLVQAEPHAADFALLPARFFAAEHATLLYAKGTALFRAAADAKASQALRSKARLPLELVTEATELKRRMLDVATYNLRHLFEAMAAELDDIISGRGHVDLASDLDRLGAAYESHATVLSDDKRKYRATDAALARALSQRIQGELDAGLSPAQRAAVDTLNRVWTLASASYREVRTAAHWIYRGDDATLALFPSLYASGSPAAPPAPTPAPPPVN
jgi:hypothetical protein